MSVNLSKGGIVDLTKQVSGDLTSAIIGCGWDTNPDPNGFKFDLDLSVVGVDSNGVYVPGTFCYFNDQSVLGGAIKHLKGDSLDGEGEGDDEAISVDLTKVPANVAKLVVWVTIFEASVRGGQTFANVNSSHCRILDASSGTEDTEISKFELVGTKVGTNAVVFGELYRAGAGWSFRAIGDESTGEIAGLVTAYGI